METRRTWARAMALAVLGAAAADAGGLWLSLEPLRVHTLQLTANDQWVFGLRRDGSVHRTPRRRSHGVRWEDVRAENDNRAIYAGPDCLYVLKPDGVLWRLEVGVYGTDIRGPGPSWRPRLDRWSRVPGATRVLDVAVSGDVVYTLQEGGEVWLHTHGTSWPVSRDMRATKVVAHGTSAWVLNDRGEVWRYLRRQPVRFEPYDLTGDVVDVAPGAEIAFLQTDKGTLRHGGRTIAVNAGGARMMGISDGDLYLQVGRQQIWRYGGELWFREYEGHTAHRIHAIDRVLYKIGDYGTVQYRIPRRFGDIPEHFGVLDLAEAVEWGYQAQ